MLKLPVAFFSVVLGSGKIKLVLSISLSSNFHPKCVLLLYTPPIFCIVSYEDEGKTAVENAASVIGFSRASNPFGDNLGDVDLISTAISTSILT